MRLSELLTERNLAISLEAPDKTSVISALVDLLAREPVVTDSEAVRTAVLDRENRMSTGVGKGLALPHAKSMGVRKSIAALATLEKGVEFDAIDGEPVHIVFLLVGPPESHANHVRVLSRISRLMNRTDVREAVLDSTNPPDLLKTIDMYEQKLIPG